MNHHPKVDDAVLAALRGVVVRGSLLEIPQKLDRPLYEKVDQVLQRLGGKWQKQARGRLAGHLFPYDPAPFLAQVLKSGEMPPNNPASYFPTPRLLIDRLLAGLPLDAVADGARFLEPSAGDGRIIEALLEKFAGRNVSVDCCEIVPAFQDILRARRFHLVAEDFLTFRPERHYDGIIMNPPFSSEGDPLAYIAHIRHAWEMLAEDGFLGSISSNGFTWRQDERDADFLTFVLTYGSWEENEAGSFTQSGTGTATTSLFLEKRDQSWRERPFNDFPSWYCWEAVMFSFYGDQERYRRAERVMRLLDDQPGSHAPDWRPPQACLEAIRAFFLQTVIDARKEQTLLRLNEADLCYLERRFLDQWRCERDIALEAIVTGREAVVVEAPAASPPAISCLSAARGDDGGPPGAEAKRLLAAGRPEPDTSPGGGRLHAGMENRAPASSAAWGGEAAAAQQSGAQECLLSAACSPRELLGALASVKEIAYYSRSKTLFLIAEDGELLVLAFWEGLSLLLRLPAQVEQAGEVELSIREAERLARMLEKGLKSLSCAQTVALSAEVIQARKGPRRELGAAFPGYFLNYRVEAVALQSAESRAQKQMLEERLGASAPAASCAGPKRLWVEPAQLRELLQYSAFAALQRYSYSLERVGESPHHAVEATVERADEGDARRSGQWRVTFSASDGARSALYRTWLRPPPACDEGRAFFGTLLLPSWTCCALSSFLPRDGEMRALVGPDWIGVRTARGALLSPLLDSATPRPALPSSPPAVKATLNGPTLLHALKQVSKVIAEGGVPWEDRMVRVTFAPGEGLLRIVPLSPSPVRPERGREVPLLECQGQERSLALATKAFEQGLSSLKRSVVLAYYDPPAPYALAVSPLVPSGFNYWLKERGGTEQVQRPA